MIQLYQYQKEVFDLTRDKPAFALFLETGTGKTILSIETIKYLREQNKIDVAIITAPRSVLRPVWIKLLQLYDFDYYVFSWIGDFTEQQERQFTSLSRNDKNPEQLLIFLINVEAFSHKRIYPTVQKILRRWHTLWIIDESTTIKSHNTKRTKGILTCSHLAEYKRILSGYPVLKSPEDLYTQIQFLGTHLIPYNSFYAFRNEFCITRQLDNRVIITLGARNTDKLNQLIKPFSIRLLKKDCLDLPEKIHTVRYVEMTAEQKRYYQQMKEEGYVAIKNSDKKSFASTLLVQLEKLHQIANGILVAVDEYINCSKYDLLVNIIKSELGDKQCVIWCGYVMNMHMTMLTLNNADITWGSDRKDEDMENFINGRIQILVANPARSRFGHTFVNASYAIYFNNTFRLEDRIQSEDRLHRIGQVNKVTYIDLVSENTNEEKILQHLEQKHSIGAEILHDDWESWFK